MMECSCRNTALPHPSRTAAALNPRTGTLRPLAENWRPWQSLAQLSDQLDTARDAQDAGLFEPEQQEEERALADSPLNPSLPAWRRLQSRLLPLAALA